MTEPRLETFASHHLEPAARLLAQRQRTLRRARPELPQRHESPEANVPLLESLLGCEGSHGVVAMAGETLAAFLLGYERHEPIWGRACWSPVEGQAYDEGIGPDILRDAYAAWSRHFVERGFFRQYVHVSADERAQLDTWSLTGFGIMQAHAARDLDLPAPGANTSFIVRRATPDDIDLVEPLAPLISMQVIEPPAYAITLPERFALYRGELAEELADPGARIWLAIEDGRALGLAGFYDAEPGPMTPGGAVELGVAMTAVDTRRRGVMTALLRAGFAEARAAGARHSITDWRTASLRAHRSWMALGYRPTHWRMHRHIDERVTWADGRHAEPR